MDTTGNRIKKARLAAGMTQTELANKIGVQHAAIYKYETGLVVNLKRDTIEKLAIALDVKPSYLLCIDDESPAISEDDKALLEEVMANPELLKLLRKLKQIEPDRLAALAKLVEPMP